MNETDWEDLPNVPVSDQHNLDKNNKLVIQATPFIPDYLSGEPGDLPLMLAKRGSSPERREDRSEPSRMFKNSL